MSSTEREGCWDKCLWWICSCGGKRIFRVTPSDPIPTVDAGATPTSRNEQLAVARAQNAMRNQPSAKDEEVNGHINNFFVPDENNSDGSLSGDARSGNRIINNEKTDLHLDNSLFIEVGRDRRMRVVYLKQEVKESSPDQPDSPLDVSNASEAGTSPSSKDAGAKPEEEEDEYWFSKWTRKPRFRSIFEKNTIHCGSEDDDLATGGGGGGSGNGDNTSSGGSLSKEFEIARAAAAAKRRAWAYNNGTCDPVVEHSTKVENDEEEEFNSIDICDTMGQRWSKGGGNNPNAAMGEGQSRGDALDGSPSPVKVGMVEVEVQNHDKSSKEVEGFTNLGFEDDDQDVGAKDGETDTLEISPTTPTTSAGSSLSDKVEEESPNGIKELSPLKEKDEESPLGSNGRIAVKLPLLFFLHGISGSSDVWKGQMDFFHNLGYEIVAPDLLGHGYSSSPSNVKYYFFESLAQDLLSVYDHFVQEDRKVVVIGHGYGACLASVISRVRPKSSCVLISIAGGGPTPLVSRTCCRSSLIPFYCKLFHTNKKKGRFDNPELKNILSPIVHENILTGQVWSDGDSAFYRRITVPTLLVYGMKDKVVNLVEECEMERTIPKSFLEIIDSAGHMVMFDEPAKLNKMLAKFIQSWS